MHQPVLPHFPDGPLNQEELDRFSEELMQAYSRVRVTTNLRPQAIIKRIPVRLDINVPSTSSEENKPESEKLPEPELAKLQEIVPPLSESIAVQYSETQRCFLHPKPKSSCKRCQEYLDFRRTNPDEPSPKKPKP